jgi:hypothetical protein
MKQAVSIALLLSTKRVMATQTKQPAPTAQATLRLEWTNATTTAVPGTSQTTATPPNAETKEPTIEAEGFSCTLGRTRTPYETHKTMRFFTFHPKDAFDCDVRKLARRFRDADRLVSAGDDLIAECGGTYCSFRHGGWHFKIGPDGVVFAWPHAHYVKYALDRNKLQWLHTEPVLVVLAAAKACVAEKAV